MIKTFAQLKKSAKKIAENSKKIRVAILGDTATQFLNVSLKGTAFDKGFNFEIYEADFGQISRQVLDPTSEYYEFEPEYTIIFEASHKLLSYYYKSYPDQINFAQNKINYLEDLYQNITSRTKSKVIFCNFPEIDPQIFGNFSQKVESSFVFQQRKLNFFLAELALKNSNMFIADLCAIQNKIGRDIMFSPNISYFELSSNPTSFKEINLELGFANVLTKLTIISSQPLDINIQAASLFSNGILNL